MKYPQRFAVGGLAKLAMSKLDDLAKKGVDEEEVVSAFRAKPQPTIQTVAGPLNYAFDIYDKRRIPEFVREAAGRVQPESPLLALLNTSRAELADIGRRRGNYVERPYVTAAKPKGAKAAAQVATVRNANRIKNIIEEARAYPELYEGMTGWYSMDPLYSWMRKNYGAEMAAPMFDRLNALTSMSSPGSDVLTEINRGTAANWLAEQGRFDDFLRYGGVSAAKRGEDYPDDMRAVMGHAYHSTAQSPAMLKYLTEGLRDGRLPMDSPKVPSYYRASSVPELGVQTAFPVGDAHWSRLVGLPDVRPLRNVIDKETGLPVQKVNAASASTSEMVGLTPWWQKLSADMGMEPVPAQALVWGAGSGKTGVTSPIGAPKLELFMMQVDKAAKRMGVDPETALDLIVRGKAHAG